MKQFQLGITLIELMVVVTVVAILAGIGVPTYRQYMIRTNRTEAKTALLQLQVAQEKFYLQNNAYTANVTAAPPAGLGLPATTDQGFYGIAVALGAGGQSFTATATPVVGGGQDDDSKCTAFSITNAGTRGATGPLGTDGCWH
jgi:type IV pilus assembly protein PilE